MNYLPNGEHVKARTSIFTSQADEYWVLSRPDGTTFADDPIFDAKLDLERLGYNNIRNSHGELDSSWDSNFINKLKEFMSDFGSFFPKQKKITGRN